jgi:PAS domain S-box-containing protein
MTKVESLRSQLAVSLLRLSDLQRRAERVARREANLPRVVDELERALHELQIACDELRQQNDELLAARAVADAERSRWKTMFEAAPLPYVLTDTDGIIRAANEAASGQLAISRRFLVGRPLSMFVDGGRASFVEFVRQFHAGTEPAAITFNLRPREHAPAPVTADVQPFPLPEGGPGLWWVFRKEARGRRPEAREA